MKTLEGVFENKHFDLNGAINKSYMNNGIGCLAVKIEKFDDVISRYSGEGYECLNYEFYSYLDRNIRYIPPNIPILIQIYGCKLSQEEKDIIIENVKEHYLYCLGSVIEENNFTIRKIVIYLVLAIVFFVLSMLTEEYDMLSDFLNLAFWFYGSTVVTFFAVDLYKGRKNRTRAGQIANMIILINEKIDKSPISDEDKEMIYSHIKNH